MKIIITHKDEDLYVNASEPITTTEAINVFLSTILTMMNNTVKATPHHLQQDITNYLFDLFNQSASTLLAQFCPDKDLRPDITEEALLIAELQIQEKHNNQHKLKEESNHEHEH